MQLFLRIVHSTLYITYVVITFFFAAGIGIFLSIFTKDKTEFRFKHSKRWFKYFVLPPSLNKIKIVGLDNIPKDKPVIFISNHGSYFDVPIYLAYLPGSFRFIVRKGLIKIPLIGGYIRLSGHMSIDRAGGTSAHKTLNKAKELLRQGKSIIIFPEGTRTKDGSLGEFKRGSLLIAFDTEVPVVPIAIAGTYNIMPRGSLLIYPGKVKITIGKPILFNDIKGSKKEMYEKNLLRIRNSIIELMES